MPPRAGSWPPTPAASRSVALAAAAALAGAAPAHANLFTKEVCTEDVGTHAAAWVNYCEDLQISDTGIVTTAAGLYVCNAVTGCTGSPIVVERTGAGVDTSTRQVCYMVYGNGGRGLTCI